jgi:hypothetical protein
MRTTAIEIEGKVDELLAVLDKDIEHIQESLSALDELRRLVVKRDDEALGKLLEGIRSKSDIYKSNEVRRQSIQKELAKVLDCDFEQVTLTRLEAELDAEKRSKVSERKTVLRALTVQLKKEHQSTALLLSDCARFNRVLLNSIFKLCTAGTVTYDSNGFSKRQGDLAFVSLRF